MSTITVMGVIKIQSFKLRRPAFGLMPSLVSTNSFKLIPTPKLLATCERDSGDKRESKVRKSLEHLCGGDRVALLYADSDADVMRSVQNQSF